MSINLTLGHTQLIRNECALRGLTRQQTAYVLATALWETNRTMLPVEEAYYLGAKAEAYRRKLKYWPWHGRGFVQLTWLDNYLRAGKELDVDLTTDPAAAMKPDVAARILVLGMERGWFTGKKLADFIGTTVDYRGARRIVNGTDRADEIASLARQYETALAVQPDPVRPPRPAPAQSIWITLGQLFARIFTKGA
ncbi:carboxypeptidase [Cereibacter sp. SYSU M97828]|nr:carboxypeptidase [Cereibacter flavus]